MPALSELIATPVATRCALHGATDQASFKRGVVSGTTVRYLHFDRPDWTLSNTLDWLGDNASLLEETVDGCGGVLLRELPGLYNQSHFDAVIGQLAPPDDKRKEKRKEKDKDKPAGTGCMAARSAFMQPSEAPAGWSVAAHQELAHLKSAPDRVALFFEQPASRGGETTLCDMRKVLPFMPMSLLAEADHVGLQLRRAFPSAATAHLKPDFHGSWQDLFGTADADVVEQIVDNNGWHCRWRDEGQTLQLWQDVVAPTQEHPGTGESVWRNAAHHYSPLCMMAGALEDGRVADYELLAHARRHTPHVLDTLVLGNDEALDESDCLHARRVLKQAEVSVPARKGDLLILDNLHYGHGRRAYRGERRVLHSHYARQAGVVA
ncbi:TauD/TfdA family dioxygenase [soil metagenome]